MMEVDLIAKVCHEANRAYCQTLGDLSQVSWEDAPDWQRESVIDGVKFFMRNPAAPVFMAHQNWMKQKVAEGWVYGKTKDPVDRTHPCMLPFDELPESQKRKDLLFHNVVFSMISEM